MPTSASNSGRGQKISLPTCLPSNRRSWRHEEAYHLLKHNSRVTLVSNVCTRASVSYPSRYDTASQHGSDQSRSSRACQIPLWLHSQTLHTYLYIRSGSFDVRAEVYY